MGKLKDKIKEETLDSVEWTERFEEKRDEAFAAGMKDNVERIEKLSNDEKEAKRHSCYVEMNALKRKITSLWDRIAEETYKTQVLQRIVQNIMIAIFSALFTYAFLKKIGILMLAIIVIGGILAVVFLSLTVTYVTLSLFTGLASTIVLMEDYYKKYGDLESILKLSDYRGLHADEIRKNLTHPDIVKGS